MGNDRNIKGPLEGLLPDPQEARSAKSSPGASSTNIIPVAELSAIRGSRTDVTGVIATLGGTLSLPTISDSVTATFEDNDPYIGKAHSSLGAKFPSMILRNIAVGTNTFEMPEGTNLMTCDVAGSTRMFRFAEGTSHFPELMITYKELHKVLTSITRIHNGDVLQFLGDAQCAVFPNKETDSLFGSLKSHIDPILSKLESICEKIAKEKGTTLEKEDILIGLRVLIVNAEKLQVKYVNKIGVIMKGNALNRMKKLESGSKEAETAVKADPKRINAIKSKCFGFKYEKGDPKARPLRGTVFGRSIEQRRGKIELAIEQEKLCEMIGITSEEEIIALSETKTSLGVTMFIEIANDDESTLHNVRERIISIVESYGGYVNKAIESSGLLVVFGAGFDTEDGDVQLRAISCAKAIEHVTKSQAYQEIQVAVGISGKGKLTRLLIGDEFRNEVTIYGDKANFGSRMKDIAKKRLADDTPFIIILEGAHPKITGRTLHVSVKGSTQNIEVTQVDGIKPTKKTKLLNIKKNATVDSPEFRTHTGQHPYFTLQQIEGENASYETCLNINPASTDRFTPYELLFSLIKEGVEEKLNTLGESDIKLIEDFFEKIVQMSHAEIDKLLPNVIKVLFDEKTIFHITNGKNADKDSMSSLGKIASKKSIKLYISHDENESNEGKIMNSEDAYGFAIHSLEEVSGEEVTSQIFTNETYEKIIKTIDPSGMQINIYYLETVLKFMYIEGKLRKEDAQWKLDDSTIDFTQISVFTNMINSASRSFTLDKQQGLHNFALIFALGEPISFEDIDSSICKSIIDWERFTAALIQTGYLKKIQPSELQKEIYGMGDLFIIAPSLQSAAMESLEIAKDKKASLHMMQFAKHNNKAGLMPLGRSDGLSEKDWYVENRRRYSIRQHTVHHGEKYFEYSELTEDNAERFYELLLAYKGNLRHNSLFNDLPRMSESVINVDTYVNSVIALPESETKTKIVLEMLELLSAYASTFHRGVQKQSLHVLNADGTLHIEHLTTNLINALPTETAKASNVIVIKENIRSSIIYMKILNLTKEVDNIKKLNGSQKTDEIRKMKVQLIEMLTQALMQAETILLIESVNDITMLRKANGLRKMLHIAERAIANLKKVLSQEEVIAIQSAHSIASKYMKFYNATNEILDALSGDRSVDKNNEIAKIQQEMKNIVMQGYTYYRFLDMDVDLEILVSDNKRSQKKEAIKNIDTINIGERVVAELARFITKTGLHEEYDITNFSFRKDAALVKLNEGIAKEKLILDNSKNTDIKRVVPRTFIYNIGTLTVCLNKLARQYNLVSDKASSRDIARLSIHYAEEIRKINNFGEGLDNDYEFELPQIHNSTELSVLQILNAETPEERAQAIEYARQYIKFYDSQDYLFSKFKDRVDVRAIYVNPIKEIFKQVTGEEV